MENITLDIIIAIATVIASFAVMKHKVSNNDNEIVLVKKQIKELNEFMNSHKPMLEHFSRIENAFGSKIDIHSNSIVELQQRISQAPSMNEVRAEFVSKELFKQLEKHMDEKFNKLDAELDKIDTGIHTILEKLSERK